MIVRQINELGLCGAYFHGTDPACLGRRRISKTEGIIGSILNVKSSACEGWNCGNS